MAEISTYHDEAKECMNSRATLAIVLSFGLISAGQTSKDPQQTSYQSRAEQTVAILLADNGSAPIPGFLQTLVSQLGDDAGGLPQYCLNFSRPKPLMRICKGSY